MRRPSALPAALVAAGVLCSSPASAAPPTDPTESTPSETATTALQEPQRPSGSTQSEAAERYAEGQKRLEQSDFAGAADVWEQLLENTPEDSSTTSMRENLLVNVIDARIQAYERQVDATGAREPMHLLAAQVTLRRYYREHARRYGDRRAVSPSVQQRADDLRRAMDTALPVRGNPHFEPTASWHSSSEERYENAYSRNALAAQHEGSGLIIGGAGLGVLGVTVGLTMLPLGAVFGRTAESRYVASRRDAVDADNETERSLALADLEDERRRGRASNRVMVAGGILTPLLLGASATMIVLGLQRRQQARETSRLRHAPTLSPTYAGWNTTVQF